MSSQHADCAVAVTKNVVFALISWCLLYWYLEWGLFTSLFVAFCLWVLVVLLITCVESVDWKEITAKLEEEDKAAAAAAEKEKKENPDRGETEEDASNAGKPKALKN